VRDLLGCGYSLFSTLEHDNGRLATVRLRRHIGGVGIIVDLLFASSGIEPEIVEAAEAVEISPKLTLPVATTGHLIALKLLPAMTTPGRRILRTCEHFVKPRRRTTSPRLAAQSN
jgi:hypothetical protein